MSSTDESPTNVDVIVIGLGPAGEVVGGELARAGMTVVGIERDLVGGECPYWGCVPSKMMVRAAGVLAESRRVGQLAGSSTTTPDWTPVATRIRDEATDDWDDTVAVQRFVDAGGIFVRGEARITAPGAVAVDDMTFVASKGLVIATGTAPAVPPLPGLADTPFWTNHDIIETEELPRSLLVLGGGAIGAELAQVMVRFGVEVTVIEGTDRLLPHNEPEAGQLLADVFTAEGISVHTGQFVDRVDHDGEQFTATMPDGSTHTGQELLVATGRQTFLRELGVEHIGLDPDANFLDVDEHQRVTDGLWAVGDIAGAGMFTHLATRQAAVATADILGAAHDPLNLDALPAVTFTDPEIGAVGLTEAAARDRGVNLTVVTKDASETSRGWMHGVGNEGFVKLVIDRDAGVIVGATSAGPVGGEVLGLLTLAVHARTPVATLRNMIYAYPTFHKGVEDALNELD